MTQPNMMDAEYTTPFNTAFEDMQEGIQKAVDGFNNIVQSISKWSWLLGAAVLWWLKTKLDELRELLQKLVDMVQHALERQTPVLSLIITSFDWVTDVKQPVSELSFETTRPAAENLAKWSGDAATAYNVKALQQKGAVDESVVKSEFISQWLFKIAKSNVEYAVQLAKIVTGVAGKVLAAAAECTDVINIPWAIDKVAESAGDLITAGLNTLLSIGQRFVEALGNVRDLATQVGDHSKLPGGNWPEAVHAR